MGWMEFMHEASVSLCGEPGRGNNDAILFEKQHSLACILYTSLFARPKKPIYSTTLNSLPYSVIVTYFRGI